MQGFAEAVSVPRIDEGEEFLLGGLRRSLGLREDLGSIIYPVR